MDRIENIGDLVFEYVSYGKYNRIRTADMHSLEN